MQAVTLCNMNPKTGQATRRWSRHCQPNKAVDRYQKAYPGVGSGILVETSGLAGLRYGALGRWAGPPASRRP